ncbi:adenylyl-sulfate kinase [Arthrobacter sp. STN4]|uniref:adenylyl-sulfate kinase n=1 Tax=Arthrobacter sp. STN4 TaxID=2923276 RepID=UPI002119F74E|nr:adenylyl-sulfate kinase [Arthrobacter sp. STN4]MCQ9163632.1 adenylyl-sulfate kinase [Arthrobacter sp. STN4]
MATEQSGAPAAVLALSGARLDELELLTGGLLAPADGYCLPHAVPGHWPAPLTLAVPPDLGRDAVARGWLLVGDPDGTPLARLGVEGSQASADGSSLYLAGRLAGLRSAEHPPARRLRVTGPLHAMGPGRPGTVAAVFSETPRPWQLAEAMSTALRAKSVLWLIALCGPQPHGRYTVAPLLHELESAAAHIDGARTGLLVLPADPVGPSPQDRVLRKQVLANLGADHTLDCTVAGSTPGRSRTGVGNRHDGGTPAPAGTVVFLTGLSGSGKSTVARALAERLQRHAPSPPILLDGDDVRRILSPGLGFSRGEREANIHRIGWVASLVAAAGGLAICAPIAPFDETRRQVRAMAEGVGRFVLVHISTPLPVCEARDRKGLYAMARRGEVRDFTGIDSPYDHPQDADLHLDTSRITVGEAVEQIVRLLQGPAGAARQATPGPPAARCGT